MVTAHPVPHPPRNPGKGEMPGLSRRRPRMGREMGSPVRRPQRAPQRGSDRTGFRFRASPQNRNTATVLILRGFSTAAHNTIRNNSRNAPGWRNRSESGQRDRDLWPGGNTAPETTLLSGYGVDTLRRADNVRGTGNSCCPGEFQRGLTRRAREQRRVGGTSPTLLRARAWPGTPSPIQSYTCRGSMRSQSPG